MGGNADTQQQQEGLDPLSKTQPKPGCQIKGLHSPSNSQDALLGGFSTVVVTSLILGAHFYFLSFLFQVSQDFEAEIIDYVALWIPLFFASLIIEGLYSEYYSLNIIRLNDTVGSLSLGSAMTITKSLWGSYISLAPYTYVWTHFRLTDYFASNPYGFWMMFVIVEFVYYWIHRTGHTIHAGWAMHGVHHSSEEYNLSTALRQSSLHGLFSILYHVPAALFFHPTHFYLNHQFNLLYQFWIHTSAIPKLGVLEYVLNTPSQHRVHHGRNDYCIDKNYGGTLCVFDRLFGTFEEEREDEPVVYGVTHGLESFGPIWPNWDLWQPMVLNQDAKTVKDYLLRFYYGPGWIPNTYEPHEEYQIPPITRETQQKFNPILPVGLHRYTFVNFAIIMVFLGGVFNIKRTQQNFVAEHYNTFLLYGLYTLISFTQVVSRSKWAVVLESLRFALALFAFERYSKAIGEEMVLYGGAVLCVLLWSWLMVYRKAFSVPLREFEIGKDLPQKQD